MQKVNSLQGNLRSQKTLLLVSLLVLIADQLTKLWASLSLSVGQSWPKEGFLRFTHVNNEGIVFGLSIPEAVTIVLPILVIAAALFLTHRYALLHNRLVVICLGLFIGGNIGNLIDRIRQGYVTDFIDFNLWGDYHWPAFNVADIAIVVAVALVVWFLLRLARSPEYD